MILLGNKSDVDPVVSTDQGRELALKFGAFYLEVSAKNDYNIDFIFEVIVAMKILN